MDRESALKKVQKLMAMAQDDRGNAQEAERALAQAEAMMRKFGIEEAEVGSSGAASPTFDWASDFAPYGVARQPAKSVPMWYQYIATGVGIFTDTIVKLQYSGERGYGVGFYGERADVLFAVWLQTFLRDTVWREVIRAKKQNLEWDKKACEDFRKGMAIRLHTRMSKLRQERNTAFAEAGTGRALIVVDRKIALRNEKFGEQTYGKKQNVEYRNGNAAAAGRAAGDRVGFSRPVGNSAATSGLLR